MRYTIHNTERYDFVSRKLDIDGKATMPISRRRFDAINDDDEVSPQTLAERIVGFLHDRRDQAFRLTEIRDETRIKHGSICPTLSRLKERGIVEHRANYWTLSDSYMASEEAAVYTNQVAAQYDDDKQFNVSAWADQSEDPNARQYRD
ncbi:MarR family transcriptional regulator [Haloprofundus halophilus]|uniref:MarR family transcriptional regulator n=1 Tax=Haloprofundus halophilus TaxID=2283527 RepID=UPI001E46684A|nr:MarR family transcriptional regulator [Haloprofundus halophilus]